VTERTILLNDRILGLTPGAQRYKTCCSLIYAEAHKMNHLLLANLFSLLPKLLTLLWLQFTNVLTTVECLYLASLSSLVQFLF
jgi:hypothetical protein